MRQNPKTRHITETKESPGKLKISLAIIIGIFAFVLYSQSIGFGYTLDDPTVTTDNKLIVQGLKGIPTIMTTDYWYGFGAFRVPQYRPLSLVSFAVEWQLFPANPHVSHFVNVLLYAITCCLLFLFLSKLFQTRGLIIPFFCALLYAAHPIHTEVVNNIKSRDEILCFLFLIISGMFSVRAVEKNRLLNLILASIFYFLGILSKETAISFLVVLPLILFVFTKSTSKPIIYLTTLLFIATAVYLFIRWMVLKSMPVPSNTESILNNTLYATPSFINREATAFWILLRYIFLLIFPHPLSYDYSYAQIPIQEISSPGALLAFIVYLFLLIFSIYKIRTKNLFAFGILFYLATLGLVSNVFMIIGATMAERFMYMPSLGFCLVVTLLVVKLTKKQTVKNKFKTVGQFISANSFLFAIAFILAGLYSIKTFTRSLYWKDNATLFTHDVQDIDNSAVAHNNAGTIFLFSYYPKENNQPEKNNLLDKAIVAFNRAVEICPGYLDPHRNLVVAYANKEDFKNAIMHAEIVRKNSPALRIDDLKQTAFLYFRMNQTEKALKELDTLLINFPGFAKGYNDKGFILSATGNYSEAIKLFQKAIDLDPKYAQAYSNMGGAYCYLNQYVKGLECFHKAAELDPNDAENYDFMSKAYEAIGKPDSARIYLDKAAKLKVNSVK